MTTTLDRVTALQDFIRDGRILEAMTEFYAEDVVMQENTQPPTRGRQENIDRERAWLDTVAEFQAFEVLSAAATDEVSFVETRMAYVGKDGETVDLTQVARARWKDGLIVDERFYHG